ncbi:unnamed protein product, partial [Strongylus vulgaris]
MSVAHLLEAFLLIRCEERTFEDLFANDLYTRKRASNVINFDHIPLEDQIVCLFPGQGAQYVGMGSK